MEKKNKHVYNLLLTKRQVELLSYACDRFSRLIEGQDWSYQEMMEEAWEKRCKEATGKMMDDEWDGGWHNMRAETEELCKRIKKKYWGLESNALYGIHYDDTSDILFALHTVLRHQLWLDRPEESKSHITVDSDEPMRVGSEPLAVISRTDKPTPKELMNDIAKLYADIDTCIMDLVHARKMRNDTDVANIQHKMEPLMVATQQELQVINDYLTKE